MFVVRMVAELKQARAAIAEPVGFVPTMGYLHRGHLSLVEQAKKDNTSVVASIFVNPAQFCQQEDLAHYPRDEARDLNLLQNAGVDIAFLPSADEMYPPGFNTWVTVGGVTERLEGALRPGHFRGVATVCNKLFNMVAPKRAYFGQKDAQQVVVIKKMVADLDMNLEVVVLPTVREHDGLAMSSRNSFLTPAERKAAPVLFRALELARELYEKGETSASSLRATMQRLICAEPAAEIDYLSVADTKALEEMDIIRPPALVSLAVRLGRTRLIDNIILEAKQAGSS
jgi:pantoate--beta-alanine ligase